MSEREQQPGPADAFSPGDDDGPPPAAPPAPLPGPVAEELAAERAERTRAAGRRPCRYCGGALPAGKRADALDCSDDHRRRYHRE
ncbi:hypothetical protein AB0H75_50105, partial [Nonomuraea sp. NPDC050783]